LSWYPCAQTWPLLRPQLQALLGAASAKASSSLADVDAQPPQPASSDSAKSEILKFERDIVVNENAELRRYCLALQTELYAARLTAKYLNKELAGRVQQMQLLTASSNGTGLDGVSACWQRRQRRRPSPDGPWRAQGGCWSQLEAEIDDCTVQNFASSESRSSFRCQAGEILRLSIVKT
uniref:Striatin domain-containing protein n=1 Tax=Macrostomum lignano TaxID=282301 RepID=A0A1I8F4Q8_9PLAT